MAKRKNNGGNNGTKKSIKNLTIAVVIMAITLICGALLFHAELKEKVDTTFNEATNNEASAIITMNTGSNSVAELETELNKLIA